MNKELLRWFGNSEIVDDDGNPLVVYHTTSAEFDEFDINKLGNLTNDCDRVGVLMTARLGFWFSTNSFADENANIVMSCILKMENPYYIETLDYLIEDLGEYASERGLDEVDWDDYDNFSAELREIAEEFVDELKDDGYDGIVIENDTEYEGTSFIVFDSSQVKIVKKEKMSFR